MSKCEYCGTLTYGSSGLCRTHKFASRRGFKRVKEEGLLIDTAGGAWWIWDKRGEVLVIGQEKKRSALIMLDLGIRGDEPEEHDE